MAVLGADVVIYVVLNWPMMPVLQRIVGLFFVANVLRVWEEMRFPGGVPEMAMRPLNFALPDRHAAELIVGAYVLYLSFVPLFFPHVA
jgi:hypothetical protein